MTEEVKRLYRSRTDTRIVGVCGGLGAYFGVDPVVVRLLWLIGTCVTGFAPGIIAYLLAWLIVPEEPAPPEPAAAAPQVNHSQP